VLAYGGFNRIFRVDPNYAQDDTSDVEVRGYFQVRFFDCDDRFAISSGKDGNVNL